MLGLSFRVAIVGASWQVCVPLLLCCAMHAVCVRCAAENVSWQARVEIPPLDSPPVLGDGQALFQVAILVKSKQLGLSSIVADGMKVIMSQHAQIDPSNWYLLKAAVESSAQSLYVVVFDVVVPSGDAKALENLIRTYIDSGGLSNSFADLGLPGLEFQVVSGVPGGDAEAPETSLAASPEVLAPEPAAPTEEPFYDSSVDVSFLVDTVPIAEEDMDVSRGLDLYVRSPTLFFPVDLKKAVKWFFGEETETNADTETWFMPDLYVLNVTLGQYIATFVYYGDINGAERVLARAEDYVRNQGLTSDLLNADAKDVNISLLPQVAIPKPDLVPSPPSGFSIVDILFRISAPVSGLSNDVLSVIKETSAEVTTTDQSDWTLKGVDAESENGPFTVDFALVAAEGSEAASVRNITRLVRSRGLDHILWDSGKTDVRVRVRARLTTFEKSQSGSGGAAITSTAGTVTASIAGMILVVAIGAGILCLVPRGDGIFGPSRSETTGLDGNEPRRWWPVWR